MNEWYIESLLSRAILINRLRYRGKGRPRKGDYITLDEAQKQSSEILNMYLDNLRFKV